MATKITTEEWDFVCFSDQFWRENGCFPNEEEIEIGLGKNQTEIAFLLDSEVVKKHLKVRGVDWEQTNPINGTKASDKRKGSAKRLSDIQLAAVSLILNPMDNRTIKEKLESLGVSPSTYNNWKKGRIFMDYLTKQGEMIFSEAMPEVHNSVASRATRGDLRAAKLLYEVTGRWRGVQQEDTTDVKMLVIRLIEILQRRIDDPILLQQIAQDIQEVQLSQLTGVPIRGEIEESSVNENFSGESLMENRNFVPEKIPVFEIKKEEN